MVVQRRWFLSYHSPDHALAERLKAAIERKDPATRVFFAPTHLRGRITSVLQVQPLCMALGVYATGALSDVFGPVAVAAGNGLIAFALGVGTLALSRRMRTLRLSELVEAAAAESRAADVAHLEARPVGAR